MNVVFIPSLNSVNLAFSLEPYNYTNCYSIIAHCYFKKAFLRNLHHEIYLAFLESY